MVRYIDDHGRQYLQVCPRGFANETTIYQVPSHRIVEAQDAFANFEDDVERGGYTNWLLSAPDFRRVRPWSECPKSVGWH
jgi:hypothetical protein